jgi:hypothetical protein
VLAKLVECGLCFLGCPGPYTKIHNFSITIDFFVLYNQLFSLQHIDKLFALLKNFLQRLATAKIRAE